MARSVVTALKALLLLALFALPAYAAGKASTKPEPKAPTWQQLSPPQKQVLGELESQWEQQPDKLRNSLVRVANKYPKMKPEEQARVRRRITRWASLTPEQRQAARERYKQIKKQPPEKQKEVKKKWESYQSQRTQPGVDATQLENGNAPIAPVESLDN
jgi:Skp family chaperone for outer membrane proteins